MPGAEIVYFIYLCQYLYAPVFVIGCLYGENCDMSKERKWVLAPQSGRAFFIAIVAAVPHNALKALGWSDTCKVGDIVVSESHRQCSFWRSVPPGNYSGITSLGNDRYAVVSDKSQEGGFFIFDIKVDSVSGEIQSVKNTGFVVAGLAGRDEEGIAYVPESGTVFVCGEADNRVVEYGLDGLATGRELAIPSLIDSARANYGLESLSYSTATRLFWTATESTLPCDGPQAVPGDTIGNRLRLMCFDENLRLSGWFYYETDRPMARRRPSNYAMGISDICALNDGRLIVMEREFFVPSTKLGAWVVVKLYVVNPIGLPQGAELPKTELLRFKTRLNFFHRNLANYEGLCLGPTLNDGRQVVILVSDSQDRYGGILKDYFKTIVLDTK